MILSNLKKNLEILLSVDDEAAQGDSSVTTATAAAALLLEAAHADSRLDDDELRQIEVSLIKHLRVDPDDIRQTMHDAQRQLDHSTCLHEMTKLVNQNWTVADKVRLIESMWKVVLSDQHIDSHEQHLMRKIKGLLHIPQSEYIAAKLRARNAIGES